MIMSDNKTEYSYYIKVKNESARKRLGFPFAFWWKTESSEAVATARLAVSMLDAGFEPTDFAKPVRVNSPLLTNFRRREVLIPPSVRNMSWAAKMAKHLCSSPARPLLTPTTKNGGMRRRRWHRRKRDRHQ